MRVSLAVIAAASVAAASTGPAAGVGDAPGVWGAGRTPFECSVNRAYCEEGLQDKTKALETSCCVSTGCSRLLHLPACLLIHRVTSPAVIRRDRPTAWHGVLIIMQVPRPGEKKESSLHRELHPPTWLIWPARHARHAVCCALAALPGS